MIFIVLTWVLWFFEYDIRNIKYIIKDKFSNIKARTETYIQPKANTESNINTQTQSSPAKQDELITKCMKSFDECKDISTQKYDVSITLIKAQEFNNIDEADKFYNTWRGPGPSNNFHDNAIENFFPIVLLATRIRNKEETLPLVVTCNKDGMTKVSKLLLQCG